MGLMVLIFFSEKTAVHICYAKFHTIPTFDHMVWALIYREKYSVKLKNVLNAISYDFGPLCDPTSVAASYLPLEIQVFSELFKAYL